MDFPQHLKYTDLVGGTKYSLIKASLSHLTV